MTYITGSMTDSNAPATLAGLIHTALLSEGYTLEDTVVIGTRTHKVYKSAAAINTEGIDWYLDVAYTTTGSGSIWFGAFEEYDAVAHTGGFGPYGGSIDSTAPDAIEYSRYGASKYALETNWTHVSQNLARLQTTTNPMAYWVSVTPTRVIGLTTVSPAAPVYCGQFKPYLPWKTKCQEVAPGKWNPLVTCSGAGSCVGFTRIPPSRSIYGNGGWAGMAFLGVVGLTAATIYGNSTPQGAAGYIDSNSSPYVTGPLGEALTLGISRGGSASMWGHIVGDLYDVARFGSSGATSIMRGDTATVDGDPWVLASAVGSLCYGFKAS